MIKRIIEISNPSYLHLQLSQMKIEQQNCMVASIPVEDIGILILAHPAITITQALCQSCLHNNVAIVFCDERYLPQAILLPLTRNSLHSKILRMQLHLKSSLVKKIWQQIIHIKIHNQATILSKIQSSDAEYLFNVAKCVKDNDIQYREAQAAQWYWKKIFGKEFRRNPNLDGINSHLNYGYAILRAAVARALCSAGLHPALGLHHRNQYNNFALADDLLEPFRPWVDEIVLNYSESITKNGITKLHKEKLLELLSKNVEFQGKIYPFMVSLHHYLSCLKAVMENKINKIEFPTIR